MADTLISAGLIDRPLNARAVDQATPIPIRTFPIGHTVRRRANNERPSAQRRLAAVAQLRITVIAEVGDDAAGLLTLIRKRPSTATS